MTAEKPAERGAKPKKKVSKRKQRGSVFDGDEEAEKDGKKPELKEGSKQGEMIEEISFDPEKFNPFDRESARKEEALEAIKPNQPRKVLKVKK